MQVWPHDIDALSVSALEAIRPELVINAAGKTDLAWCETHAAEAIRSNLEAPVRLYERIVSLEGIRFIHFSSGCIWDGPYNSKGKPFTPKDAPTPACLYSWTKAAADAMLLDLNPNRIAILRPRQVYSANATSGAHLRNTLQKLLQYPKLIDTPNSMSSIEIIEKTVRHVIHARRDWSGVWNVYDRGVTSPFEVAEMLWKAGLRAQPIRISKTELDSFHKPKRVDTVLYDDRFEVQLQPEEVHEVWARTIKEYQEKISQPMSGKKQLESQVETVPTIL